MTTPAYTSSSVPEIASAAAAPNAADEGRRWWLDVERHLSRFRTESLIVKGLLDIAAICSVLLVFVHPSISAEFLFHCVFVVLVLHAFLYGGRGTFIRIGLASIPLLIYADAHAFGLDEPALEVTEWPLMFVIAALVAWMAERRNSTSRRYASLFRRASERLLTVEEDERRRIAGELHDGVGQVLTALTLTLDSADAESDPVISKERISTARRLADSALAETRDLSHRIRPTRLEERGLAAAVTDLAAQSGFPISVRVNRAARANDLVGPTAILQVFRIVQEALANAAHHSGASGADVSITCRGNWLTVIVADEGRGFDPDDGSRSGIGLAGMLERSRLAGGDLSIESAPDAGTRITIVLPIEGNATAHK